MVVSHIIRFITTLIYFIFTFNLYAFIAISQETTLNQSYYIGQSFEINYVVYTDSPIDDVTVLRYPKLEGFYKKYDFDLPEDIRVKEKLWKRVKYRVQVTPAISGKLTLDPLVVSQQGESYEGESRIIDVKSLPVGALKGLFIGSVGVGHSFEVILSKQIYSPEDLVEIEIILRGPSLMDFVELPDLFPKDWTLYDKKAFLIKGGKKFHYVFSIPIGVKYLGKKFEFYEFNPLNEHYNAFYLNIPPFSVEMKNTKINTSDHFIFKPLSELEYEVYRYNNKMIDIILFSLVALSVINFIIFLLVVNFKERVKRFLIFYKFEKNVQKNRVVFNDFFSFFNLLSKSPLLDNKIEETSLSYESKRYFLNISHRCSKKEFGAYPMMELPFSSEAFEELYTYFVLKK